MKVFPKIICEPIFMLDKEDLHVFILQDPGTSLSISTASEEWNSLN